MMRMGRRTRVKPEAAAEYRRWHAEVWPELIALNTAAGIRNYSIYMDGAELFSYFEVDDFDAAMALLSGNQLAAKWQALMAPFMESDDATSPWVVLEEVYHQD